MPVVVANAHLSDRTLRRAARLRALLAPVIAGITRYLTQSPAIRDRALALGLPAARVTVVGHTKFDQEVPALTPDEAAELRARFGLAAAQPLFLAGSTHEGEEELILEAWEAARRAVPDLALMLAPRHLTRVAAVRALIERRGLAVRARSEATGVQVFRCSGVQDDQPEHLNTRTPEHLNAVLLLDTMGELAKLYGLAGLRVGYAIAPPAVADALERVRQPFNVNALALAGALAALDDDAHVERTLATNRAGMAYLVQAFDALGLAHVPSAANFVLVRVGDGARTYQALLRRGVIVRPMDGYGFPAHVRVTVGTPVENERLVAALRAVVA